MYVNATDSFIASKIKEHGARLVDIERRPGDRFSVIMIKSPASWWWYYGKTANEVESLSQQHKGRIIDLETQVRNGVRCFDFIMVWNQ